MYARLPNLNFGFSWKVNKLVMNVSAGFKLAYAH